MEVLIVIVLLAWSFFGAGVYAVVAYKLTKDREPWFSVVMVLGLGLSIYLTALFSNASLQMGVWVFLMAIPCYLGLYRLFGKNSSVEMFMVIHSVAVMAVLVLPELQAARARSQMMPSTPPSEAASPSITGP